MVFWLMVFGWILGQMVTIPMPFVAMAKDPELFKEIMSLSTGDTAAQTSQMILIFGMLVLGVFSILFFYLYKKNEQASPFGYLTIATVAAGFSCLILLFNQGTGSAEEAAIVTKLIGIHPINYALMLLTFPAAMFALLLASRKIHKRTITSVLTAASKFRWNRVFFAIGLTLIVYGLFTAIMHYSGISKVSYAFNPKTFFGFALVSLLLIPIQSATEEVIFRGYLNQALGHFVNNKWLIFTITSALFAAMHLSNPEAFAGAEQGALEHILVMSGYFFFGFILCVIVYFEGGLEAAIGVHAANNMFAAIFVNYEGSVLPTPSVFLAKAPESSDNWFLILLLGIVALLLYVTRDKTAAYDPA